MSPYRLKGTSGPLVNQSFRLGERLVLGADGDTPLDLPGAVAEVRLAEDGGVRLQVLVDDPAVEVCVNGEPVRSANLGGGDEIRVGTQRLILQAPGLRPERVLTEEAVRPRHSPWPWLLAAGAAAVAGAGWYLGWFDALLAHLSGG
ncbi:MAG: hypothetical protein P8008_02665 [Gammaproteobacteria bacterium]